MELQDGKNEFSDMTFPCDDYPGCPYQKNGRCIYNVSKVQVRIGRACYEELRQDEIECELNDLDVLGG